MLAGAENVGGGRPCRRTCATTSRRRAAAANRVATAAGFVRDYSQYGIIGATELRKLPTDLQDNIAGFARVTVPAGPPSITSLSLPLSAENVEKVRAAFVDHVQNTLTMRRPAEYEEDGFEYENGDWAELVHEFGGDGEHEALKAEALAMAASWSPSSDWEADTTSLGGVYFTGHFKFITLFVDSSEVD